MKGQSRLPCLAPYDTHILSHLCPDTHNAHRLTITSTGHTALGKEAHPCHPPQHCQASVWHVASGFPSVNGGGVWWDGGGYLPFRLAS